MKYLLYIIISVGVILFGYKEIKNYQFQKEQYLESISKIPIIQPDIRYYFKENNLLDRIAENYINNLSNQQLAGTVLMPAYEKQHNHSDLKKWIDDYHIGGFMILRDDYSSADAYFVQSLNSGLPLLISIDAEPSLVEYRLPQLQNISKTNTLDTPQESANAAEVISDYISKLGVNTNFAPVYDNNSNTSVIGDRSYGLDSETIHQLASKFSYVSMKNHIIPTAKHFPGHGNVSGDTHKNLQTINGELLELPQFKLAIDDDIPMIMVGHLAIENNDNWDTGGLPASLSKNIMTDLLQDELGFDGLIVTDALNMGALDQFNSVPIGALEAGADIVLLPKDIDQTYQAIFNKIETDEEFKKNITNKAQKIIRMKMILNYINFKK